MNPTEWLYDNLEACCDRYYPGFNRPKCMDEKGSGLWVVDWANDRCALDCEENIGGLCGGVAAGKELFLDPRSCCESDLFWVAPKFCEVSTSA